MKRMLIYPYGAEVEHLVDFHNLLKDLQPVGLVRLRGWDDGQRYCCNAGLNIPIYYEFEEGLKNTQPDVVWFADFQFALDFEQYYLPYIKLAVSEGKYIVMGRSLKEKAKPYLTEQRVLYCEAEVESIEDSYHSEALAQINTPIIYVAGLFSGLDKFALQLGVRRELEKREISVIQIGSREDARYFGFYEIPQYMLETNISEKEKILRFNGCMKSLEEKYKPDLFLIGVPGELFGASAKYMANFGMLAYEIFMSALPEGLIVSLPYDEYSEEYLEEISTTIERRFGAGVDVFHRTNKKFQLDDTEINQANQYLTVIDIDEKTSIDRLYMLNDSKQMEKAIDKIINKLIEYGKIRSV